MLQEIELKFKKNQKDNHEILINGAILSEWEQNITKELYKIHLLYSHISKIGVKWLIKDDT